MPDGAGFEVDEDAHTITWGYGGTDQLGPIRLLALGRLFRGRAFLLGQKVGSRHQRLVLQIVDHLGIDVSRAAEHHQARALGASRDPLTQRPVPFLSRFEFALAWHDFLDVVLVLAISRRPQYHRPSPRPSPPFS